MAGVLGLGAEISPLVSNRCGLMDEKIGLRVTGTACHSSSCFCDLCNSGQMLNVQTVVFSVLYQMNLRT